MGLDRPLSTLEFTVLGIVLKRAPCVAYAVVSEFAGSQTLAYRSGAGSIYPLLRRLTEGGFLSLESKRYSLTDAGRETLRGWLQDASHVSCNLDELRSRIYFLRLLTPQESLAFADSALAELRRLVIQCEATLGAYRRSGDPFSELAMLGAVRETEARISWMTEIKEKLIEMNSRGMGGPPASP